MEKSEETDLAKFGDVEKSGSVDPANSGDVENSGGVDLANSGDVEKSKKNNLAKSGDVENSGGVDLANSGDVEKSEKNNLANSGDVENSGDVNPANSGDVNRPENANLAKFGEVDRPESANLAKFGDRTSSSSSNNNINKTTTTAGPPEDDGVPTVEKIVASHTFISREDLRKAVSSLDKKLLLGDNFYARAPSFLFKNGLGPEYVSWIYEQSLIKEPDSLSNYFFTVFFLDNKVGEFKAGLLPEENPPDEKPPPRPRSCPVCGTECDSHTRVCPVCRLCDPCSNTGHDEILLFRALREFPPEKREEYLSRQDSLFAECFFDTRNFETMLAELKAEFGLGKAAV